MRISSASFAEETRGLTSEGWCQWATRHTITDQIVVLQGNFLRSLRHWNEMAWGTWTERGLSLRRCDDILRSMRSELVLLSDDMGMRISMCASYNYDSESVNTQSPDESSIKSCTVHWAWLPFFQLIVPHPLALPSLHTFWCGGCKQMLQQLRRCHWWKCDWRRCNHTRQWSRRCPWRRSWRSLAVFAVVSPVVSPVVCLAKCLESRQGKSTQTWVWQCNRRFTKVMAHEGKAMTGALTMARKPMQTRSSQKLSSYLGWCRAWCHM